MRDPFDAYELTAEELAEIDRRLAEPNPEYADDAEIAKLFGRSFNEKPGQSHPSFKAHR